MTERESGDKEWQRHKRKHVVYYLRPPQTSRPRLADSARAWCAAAEASVPHGAFLLPIAGHLVKFVSPRKSLAATSPLFHTWHWPRCDITPSGHCGITERYDESIQRQATMTTHKTDTTLNSCLLLFSLQFKSRGGQGLAQLVVMCGSHVARAWVMPLSLVRAMSRDAPQISADWNNNNCTTVNAADLTFHF